MPAGYTLTEIICDDPESPEPSIGDVPSRTATYRIEDGETVTCVFKLTKDPLNESGASSPRVHTSERITGELHSTVTQRGMTCNMSRDYELNFGG